MAERLLVGDKFVKALQDAGLLPDSVISLDIRASVNEVVTMTYEVVADERLISVISGLETTTDPARAVAR